MNYHISSLLSRGAIEIVDAKVGRGGVVSNEYALKPGSLILLPSMEEEREQLTSLQEVIDVETLLWEGARELPSGVEIENLLYKLFLHLFRITRSEHRTLLEEYGYKTGSLLSGAAGGRNAKETTRRLVTEMDRRGVASIELLEVPRTRTLLLTSRRCIGSTEHMTYSCFFLEGLIRGLIQGRHGTAARVERLELGLPACCLAVGRAKQADLEILKEAAFSSPSRTKSDTGEFASLG